ncbi:chitin synthase chs-2-like [Ambystoma mexicanum]|uniref:chitin synthase chs-2-like n=1 Tax=Ambystoma mexicanum TaxID=8296 RepID=UPI0037E960C1
MDATRESHGQQKQEEERFRRTWDPFLQIPVDNEEEKSQRFPLCLNYLICALLGVLVCAFGFFSKASFVLMIMLAGPNSLYFSNKPFGLLIIGGMLMIPNVLTFLKSVWKLTFNPSNSPYKRVLMTVCSLEAIAALGTAVLALVALPHFNVVSNTMILNSICFLPSILQVAHQRWRPEMKMVLPALSILLTILGFVLFGVVHNIYLTSSDMPQSQLNGYFAIAIIAICCASINWWENFTSLYQNGHIQFLRKNLGTSRNVVYLCSSVIRILVTGVVVGSYVPITGGQWSTLTSVPRDEVLLAFSLFAIQALSSVFCHWFGVVACKVHSLKRSFAFPMVCTTLAVAVAFVAVFGIQYEEARTRFGVAGNWNLSMFCYQMAVWRDVGPSEAQKLLSEISHNICRVVVIREQYAVVFVLLCLSGMCWWVGMVLSTSYVWRLQIQRIERTTKLFVRRLYEAAFIDQSMLLNIKLQHNEQDAPAENTRTTEHVYIYLCATMWHETFDEMLKIITSMFRLDKYRPQNEGTNKEKFDFEAHIYFDDAFLKEEQKERRVNSYVECLATVIEEVYRVFTYDEEHRFLSCSDSSFLRPKVMVTPYGGQLKYILPKGNSLYVHLKDKDRIRHRKRWSQIMYLYYLLGWKLYRKYHTSATMEGGKWQEDLKLRFQMETKNTYILALDGDTDFQPSSLLLLVDRLRMYPHVGAACGRIHPTGVGPMVWYQKFEYALAHWLQKSSEHVLGCVLCSPGCFSLFRASALMDDNVLKMYTKKATEAAHFIQYDQGEDRWLCTLLLRQGWRVEFNAASDAYTNAPQEFQEFYNQRRRWGPSTLANTLDLLHNGMDTAKKNASISSPFIVYQIFIMASSIISPATVCLMIAGAFSFVFKWNGNVAIVFATLPPALYLLLCFVTKPDTQVTIAAFMSIAYAFLMTATFLSIIGDMVQEETFMTPTGLFLIFMSLVYIFTALLHPQEFPMLVYGLLYIICVPSGYLLLTIYSMANMHVVSWGTRETSTPREEKKEEKKKFRNKALYQKKCRCFCWDIEMQVHDTEHRFMHEEKKPLLTDMEQTTQQQWEEAIELNLPEHVIQPTESWIEQLNHSSTRTVFQEDALPEDEKTFWECLIKNYLEPITEDKKTQERIQRDLKSMRNKTTFIYFMINMLWIVATFFLQLIGNSVQIMLPKIYTNGSISSTEHLFVEPIGLMFLLSFATLLIIQFIALLYHRVYTLIHFVAFRGTAGQRNGSRSGERNNLQRAHQAEFTHMYENPSTQ